MSGWESVAYEGADLDALKRLRGRLQGRCTTLLRHGQYQMLQLEAPQVPPEERAQAVRWRIKEMVDFPIEAAGVAVLDIPAPPNSGGRPPQAFAVVASHEQLRPRIRLFQDAKIPLAAIDIPELAQRNVAAYFEEENRGLAVLAFDDDGGRLTFTYGGELYATRRVDVTRGELAAATRPDAGVYERVLLDVQRSLDNFDRNFSFITLTRLLVAPLPGVDPFIAYLKNNLYQPVELLDLTQRFDMAAVPALAEAERQGDALLAIGAALRDEVRA